jgi:hypothetical protein
LKTPDTDDPSHFIPSITLKELGENHFQGQAVQGIVWLLVSHVLSLIVTF